MAPLRAMWLVALVACTNEAPADLEIEVLEVEQLPTVPIDATAGFVRVVGVVEEAVVATAPAESPGGGAETDWSTRPPWEVFRAACTESEAAAVEAVITAGRSLSGLMERCDAPVWCRAGVRALRAEPVRAAELARGLASCRHPSIDHAFRELDLSDPTVAVRLLEHPTSRIDVSAGALDTAVRWQLATEPGDLPHLVGQLVAAGHGDALLPVLVEVWRTSGYDAQRDVVGVALGRFADPVAQQIHLDACRDWGNRDSGYCVDVKQAAWVPGPALPSAVRGSATALDVELRSLRYDRDWPRDGEALDAALEACVGKTDADAPRYACLVTLARRDDARARALAAALPRPEDEELRALWAALRHPGRAAMVSWMVDSGALPPGTEESDAPAATLATDWMIATGRGLEPMSRVVIDDGGNHRSLVRALVGLSGARATDVDGEEAARSPGGGLLAPVAATVGDTRITASLWQPSPSAAMDVAGAVAFVNALLSADGSSERLFFDVHEGVVVLAPTPALEALVERGHLRGPDLTQWSARRSAAAPQALDTGTW